MLRKTAALAVLAGLVTGCSDDPAGPVGGTTVTANLSNFPASSPTEGHYELWISFALRRGGDLDPRHSEAASAGKFRIDGSGQPVSLIGGAARFEITPRTENAPVDNGEVVWVLAADAFITLEPDGDVDGDPHLPGLVAGGFTNGVSALGIDESDAIDIDLSGAAGSFVLATPTTAASTDSTEGVWFAQPGGSALALNLPTLTLATAWTYTGWCQGTAGLASLGFFRDAGAPDSDGAGPRGGTGYPYPGSDFPFDPMAVDLSVGTVFVTLEPPDDVDGAGPFLTILTATVNGAASDTSIPMTSLAGQLPGGTIEIPWAN
jgi:hypothetical protein